MVMDNVNIPKESSDEFFLPYVYPAVTVLLW